MAEQLNSFFKSKFSSLLCGFRKRHSTQHALFRLLKSWQNSLDKDDIVGTILMDLSKAYDCLPHDLLIAKLAAYGADFKSLSLLYDYLSNRFHRVKINTFVSGWLELLLGVPQGSILGPILFNIFINDLLLFTFEADICNFADDNSLYTSHPNDTEVIKILNREATVIMEWFRVNSMAANPAKFQVMFMGRKLTDDLYLTINGVNLKAKNSVKLLGVTFDCKLNFDSHIEKLCKTASQKVKALFRIRPYLSVKYAKQLCNAYILSTFNYCPLIWMFCSKHSDKLINNVHKRALRATYQDFNSSLEELLEIDQMRLFMKGIYVHYL